MEDIRTTSVHSGNGSAEVHRSTRDEGRLAAGISAASFAEVAGGTAAAVFAIIGLGGGAPAVLLSIACLVAGVGLALTAPVAAGRSRDVQGTPRRILAGGLTVEMLGGAAAALLGLLALIGVGRVALSSVAAICLGGALFFAGAIPAGRAWVRRMPVGEGVGAVEGLVGLGAVALGVVALTGAAPVTLALVALLGVGAAMILAGFDEYAGHRFAESQA